MTPFTLAPKNSDATQKTKIFNSVTMPKEPSERKNNKIFFLFSVEYANTLMV